MPTSEERAIAALEAIAKAITDHAQAIRSLAEATLAQTQVQDQGDEEPGLPTTLSG